MTSVVTAAVEATERTKAAISATGVMLKAGGFMQIIPATARCHVKTFCSIYIRISQFAPRDLILKQCGTPLLR
jgi:hypothetical protein